MFDADKRLVVCNEPLRATLFAAARLLAPGTSHEAIIEHRSQRHPGEVGAATSSSAEQALADAVSSRVDKLADGRLIKVVRAPMPGGGWVATHED